jgi:FKBP-type peptidyl-prolyl cis-trans isomerase (trigger factor)
MKTKINKLPESTVEIEGQIDWLDLELHRSEALKHLGKDLEMPGFRKGHVPEGILLKNIPEISILEEMAELAMPKAYLHILEEHKIDAIGRPEIAITKIAAGNPLEFKIKTAVLPEVKLPDYKVIAQAENKTKPDVLAVDDEEVEKAILQLRKMKLPKSEVEPKDEDLPEFNDEFVKSFGNFKDVADFKIKIKDNMRLEKEFKEKEKQRIKILDAILNKTKIDLPRILIESELDKMLHQVKGDIENSGFKFDDYLKHLNKTEEDMKKEWEKEAEKRSKLELILHAIAKQENIKADEAEIKVEMEKVLDMYKDADPTRARAYVENVLTNEKIWVFLENQ